MSRPGWIAITCAVGVAIAAGVAAYRFRKPEPAPVAATPAVEERPTELVISGTIRARHIIPVPAPTDGTLEPVEALIDGQEIFEGQLLARIRNNRIDLELEEAREEMERLRDRINNLESQLVAARLETSRAEADAARASAEFKLAERDYLRQKTLLAEGATPRLTYEKAEREYTRLKTENEALGEMAQGVKARMEVLQKNVEEARRQQTEREEDLETTEAARLEGEVHAPVSGLLIAHRAAPGDEVTTAMTDLFQIAVNLTELTFTGAISSDQAKYVEPGQPVMLQVAETGGMGLEGAVRAIEQGVLVVDFAAPEAYVRPGLSAEVRIPLNQEP